MGNESRASNWRSSIPHGCPTRRASFGRNSVDEGVGGPDPCTAIGVVLRFSLFFYVLLRPLLLHSSLGQTRYECSFFAAESLNNNGSTDNTYSMNHRHSPH